jgi:hypothetical protein
VDAAVVAFSGLMIFPNMLFTVYQIIRGKKGRSSERSGLKSFIH